MKLASLKSGRDGQLIIVSDDLKYFVEAIDIAPTLQSALDEWAVIEPFLRARSVELDQGQVTKQRLEMHSVAAPLPRAYQWADGSAYVNHVALVRQARNAELPQSFWTDPLMYQGGSDGFLGPCEPISLANADWGCDFEAEVIVVTDDVPMGVSAKEALDHITLVGLTNDVSLRNLIPDELAKGFGFFQSKPASAFSPVFVTPDSLGERWAEGRLRGILNVDFNGAPLGRVDAATDLTFDFGELIAHAAKTRKLGAGTIIGSGTVSNRDATGGPGKPIKDGGLGYSCLAEVRTVETILTGEPKTTFLRIGDRVRIWMEDYEGKPIFGVIDQQVCGV
jgi:fumarylacetoacetate (FAA) hydrolase